MLFYEKGDVMPVILRYFSFYLFIILSSVIILAENSCSAEANYNLYNMNALTSDSTVIDISQQDANITINRVHYGLCAGGGTIGSQHDGIGIFGLTFGYYHPSKRFWSDFGLIYLSTNNSQMNERIDVSYNEWNLLLEARVRKYFSPSHTLMGLHVDAGVRQGILFFRYRDMDIAIDEAEGAKLHLDAIGINHAHVGLGLSFIQTKKLNISSMLSAGIEFHYSNSVRQVGAGTDIFRPQGFIQFVIDVAFISSKEIIK